jgi:hypothetical protein
MNLLGPSNILEYSGGVLAVSTKERQHKQEMDTGSYSDKSLWARIKQ